MAFKRSSFYTSIHNYYLSRQNEEFLQQLSETMKVDSIAVDIGFDMKLKLILSRAEQLVKQEGTALAESKSLTYNLQRKVVNTHCNHLHLKN